VYDSAKSDPAKYSESLYSLTGYVELRDNDNARYLGKGCRKAVSERSPKNTSCAITLISPAAK
jgi:enolase